MSTLSPSRREFLRNALGLLVVSAASPAVVLGRVLPDIALDDHGTLLATYTLALRDYPDLQKVHGAIKLDSQELWQLNPDHLEFAELYLAAPRGRYPIAITRVAAEGPDAFKAVSTYCSHGKGYQIKYLEDPDTGEYLFQCDHKGSVFLPDGTHVDRPKTPKVGDLRKFPAIYNEAEGTVKISHIFPAPDVVGVELPPLSPPRDAEKSE